MASCDTTVLTGQEGLIQFKPLGTTNCVDDFCPFMGSRIYLSCAAEYDIGDCLNVDVDNIPSGEGQKPTGTTDHLEDGDVLYVVDTGKGIAGDEDACGNDMQGVPYIEVSATDGGTAIDWDNSEAGEATTAGVLTGENIAVSTQGTGYNGSTAGTVEGVEVISTTGGSGGVVTITVGASGAITSFTVTSGGSGYAAGGILTFEAENGAGTDASFTLTGDEVTDVRGNSNSGRYTFRLCDFQTVCGVRSFSIDLSRDELDVTTLPCSVFKLAVKNSLPSVRPKLVSLLRPAALRLLSCDQESTANKLLTGSLQKTQGGATGVSTSAPRRMLMARSTRVTRCISKPTSSCWASASPWIRTTRPLPPSTSVSPKSTPPSVFPDHWYGIAYALAYAGAFLFHYDSYVIGVINGWSCTLHRQAKKSCPS